jgi:hypothetical protein
MTRGPTLWPIGVAALIIGVAMLRDVAAGADQPGSACRPNLTDDTLRPLPPALVPRARELFGLNMPDDLIRKNTVYRCLDGRTLMCTAGANLACGRANTRRDLPGAAAWCRDHRDADSIPMFVTGHDTIYTQTTSFWGSQADGCLLRQGSGGVHRNGRFLGLRHTKGDRPWTRSCS